MTEMLERLARQQRPRRTALPASAYERSMTCQCCGDLVAVFEATAGARTDEEHRFIVPAAYVCPDCMDARP